MKRRGPTRHQMFLIEESFRKGIEFVLAHLEPTLQDKYEFDFELNIQDVGLNHLMMESNGWVMTEAELKKALEEINDKD